MDIKIQGGQTLSGEITPSGAKNLSVALLPASLLFNKPLTFSNIPDITDITRLVQILETLGSKITWDKAAKTMHIDNSAVKFDPIETKDVNSTKGIRGTTLLWGPMLARFGKAESSEQPAGCTLGARTIDPHYQAFMDLGVAVNTENNHVTLDSKNAKAGNIWLLEASPTATENAICFATVLPGITTINHAASEPNVQELCKFLNACGAKISGIGSSLLTIEGGHPLTPVDWEVFSDQYEIVTFLALGAATGGEIKVHKALPQYSTAINREFAKFGIGISYDGDTATVSANQKPVVTKSKSAMIVRAQPWPALPVDMLPLFIPLAMASPSGQVLFHNWMYESGLYWTSELLKLGANIMMCDPHRVVVTGGNPLTGTKMDAPYIIRAVVAMVMSAMIANGESYISNADSLHRGHPDFVKNLRTLGAQIEEVLSTQMVDITNLNTLRVPAKANTVVEINTVSDLNNIDFSQKYMCLGLGANVLFVNDFPGTLLKINLHGIKVLSETLTDVLIESQAGELWHNLVMFTVEKNLWGIENMALIPGTVGAAVAGNIAAYGQNQQTSFVSLSAYDTKTHELITLTKDQCGFAYRESFFKTEGFKHYIIISATYQLSKQAQPEISYNAKRHASLKPVLESMFTPPYTSKNLAEAVIKLRTDKLPDWHVFPNAGSFFKNPLISKDQFDQLSKLVPDLQAYPPTELRYQTDDNWLSEVDSVKIPAGRLLDERGWRGKKIGNVGTHEKHALVIVNFGATGQEIYAFTESIRADIKSAYDIDLEYEVQIIS